MNNFFIRLLVNAVALYAAVGLVPGITPQDPSPVSYIWLALIFGLVNALVKPLASFVSCGVILLTLGLFTLVVNTGMFYLTSWIGTKFGVGLLINNFGSAFLGALVVSVISFVLSQFLKDDKKKKN